MNNEIWNDPNVKAALKDGRPADDIALLVCPRCNSLGYYNQGSHFSCRHCGVGFFACSEGEEPPESMPGVSLDNVIMLADIGGFEEDRPGYSIHRGDCPYEHGGACTCQ